MRCPKQTSSVIVLGLCAAVGSVTQAAERKPQFDVFRQVIEDDEAFKLVREVNQGLSPEEEKAAKQQVMESDEMLVTLVWLEEYFRAQIDYDAEQVRQFRQRLATMTAGELKLFLLTLAGANGSGSYKGMPTLPACASRT